MILIRIACTSLLASYWFSFYLFNASYSIGQPNMFVATTGRFPPFPSTSPKDFGKPLHPLENSWQQYLSLYFTYTTLSGFLFLFPWWSELTNGLKHLETTNRCKKWIVAKLEDTTVSLYIWKSNIVKTCQNSTDWLKGEFTRKPDTSQENPCFLDVSCSFPLNKSLDKNMKKYFGSLFVDPKISQLDNNWTINDGNQQHPKIVPSQICRFWRMKMNYIVPFDIFFSQIAFTRWCLPKVLFAYKLHFDDDTYDDISFINHNHT